MIDLTPDEVLVEMTKRLGKSYNMNITHRVMFHPRSHKNGINPRVIRTLTIRGNGMELMMAGFSFREIIAEYDVTNQYKPSNEQKKR